MSASWLKRALVTSALAAGAMMLSGGVAHAGDLPGGGSDPVSSILQDQTASNTNSTDQDTDASASTDQVNINAPISILSSGANGGDVDQSNQADTDATAGNGNWTDQTVDQGQSAVLDGGPASGLIDQDQSATNTNDTTQDADADASTGQWNINAPVSILSSGANGGDVNQSNQADTDATAVNHNGTDQTVDQDQDADVQGSHGCGCDHRDDQEPVSQHQDGSNDNSTDQDADATATTDQSNVNAPLSILSSGANGGDVTQSNSATTDADAFNGNVTGQAVDQDQHASVQGDDGGDGYGHHDQPCGCPYPSPHGYDGGYPHDCGCAGVDSIRQNQTGSNANDTTQDATADASTHQSNVNEPFSFLSSFGHGCGCDDDRGGVSQSNGADTDAMAGNANATQQWIGQIQSVLTGKGVAA